MKSPVLGSSMIVWLFFSIIFSAMAQSGRRTQNVPVQKEAPKKTPQSEAERKESLADAQIRLFHCPTRLRKSPPNYGHNRRLAITQPIANVTAVSAKSK